MKNSEVKDQEIIDVINILEHIREIDKMIELHKKNKDPFMLEQYNYRRNKFLKQLWLLLENLNIKPVEIA